MNKQLPNLQTKKLILRFATKEDVLEIISFLLKNRNYFAPFEAIKPANFYTKEFWFEKVNKNIEEFKLNTSLRLFLFEKPNPQSVISYVSFTGFMRGAAQSCYLGYCLDKDKQGKGYMTEALKMAINYVFQELNIHRIMANYMPQNQRSASLLKRLGFIVEGYARDYLLINGKWEGHILTSLTNHNWDVR